MTESIASLVDALHKEGKQEGTLSLIGLQVK
jgi:hypothetical protein